MRRRFGAVAVVAAMTLLGTTVPNALATPAKPSASMPDLPGQPGGTAAGRSHTVDSDATRMPGSERSAKAASESPQDRRKSAAPEKPTLSNNLKPQTPGPADPKDGKFPVDPKNPKGAQRSAAGTPPKGFDAATSVEEPQRRDETTKVFRNADGTFTTRSYAVPVHVRQPDGSWADIDTTPARQPDGRLKPRQTEAKSDLAPRADDHAIQSLKIDDGHSVSLALADAAPVAPRIDGNAVTYADARPHADVKFETTNVGVKETLVLDSPQAPSTWTFPITAAGLQAVRTAEGEIEFKDDHGVVRAVIPRGWMEDSSGKGEAGAGVRSYDVAYDLVQHEGGIALRVTLDQDWLRDPKRVYPVMVDPSLNNKSSFSTFVDSCSTDTHHHAAFMVTGTSNTGCVNQAYMAFNNFRTQLPNAYVTGAALQLYVTYSASCAPNVVNVVPITQWWDASKLRAFPGPATGGVIGSASFSGGETPSGTNCGQAPGWRAIPLSAGGVDLLTSWAQGRDNYGLSLVVNAANRDAYKIFASSNGASQNAPYLQVEWSPWNARYDWGQLNPPPTNNTPGKIRFRAENIGMNTWTVGGNGIIWSTVDSGGMMRVGGQPIPFDTPNGHNFETDVNIDAMPPGSYYLCIELTRPGGSFGDQGVTPRCGTMTVGNVPPVLDSAWPPNNYVQGSLTPQLMAYGSDPDASPAGPLQYKFTVCPESGSCTESGWVGERWRVPAGVLAWDKSFSWNVRVSDTVDLDQTETWWSTFRTEVPQPGVSSNLAGKPGEQAIKGVDPYLGNYTTESVDASIKAAGPALEIRRTYNSLDPRGNGIGRGAPLFGPGWSTVYDTRIWSDDIGAMVTYPDGRQVRFGRNSNGTYEPPSSRQSTLLGGSSGWLLTDKSGFRYIFDQWGRLTQLATHDGRTQTITYNNVLGVDRVVDDTSGRSLRFTWNASPLVGGHVTKVTADAPSAAARAPEWTYEYTGAALTKVCSPDAGTKCTVYGTTPISQYRSLIADAMPESYMRLGDSTGSATAAQEPGVPVANADGRYSGGVVLGVPGALTGSSNTAARFNGSSSVLELWHNLQTETAESAIEMWFRSTSNSGGVLYGMQNTSVRDSSGALNLWPALYVGTDGKLRGSLPGITAYDPMTSASSVTDGAWHHVVLTADGVNQQLWLDGRRVDERAGVAPASSYQRNASVGAGYIHSWWPAAGQDIRGWFNGDIDELALYDHPLSATLVGQHSDMRAGGFGITSITTPEGKTAAGLTYALSQDRVQTVTDINGGQYWITLPNTAVTSAYYPNSVLKARPYDYFRLGERSGTTAKSTVFTDGHDSNATYTDVALGMETLPLLKADDTAAGFNGSTSQVKLPDGELSGAPNLTAQMWFKTDRAGVLLSSQKRAINDPAVTTGDYTPVLYVGTDGRVHGQFWDDSLNPLTSQNRVDDGSWHMVTLIANGGFQLLIVDGAWADSRVGKPLNFDDQRFVYVGAGAISGGWPAQPSDKLGHFSGTIDEVAIYRHADLGLFRVTAQYRQSLGVWGETIQVIDPGTNLLSYMYEPGSRGRLLSYVDAAKGKWLYDYDDRGYLKATTDPNAHTVRYENDERGNVRSKETCRKAWECQRELYKYYLDEANPTDPRNDQVIGSWDARAAGYDDNRYARGYIYDASGRLAISWEPDPLDGGGSSQFTLREYTAGTEAAAGGGTQPKGLVKAETTPGGKKTAYAYNRAGDLVSTVAPSGLEMRYTHDALGRVLTQTEVSDSQPAGAVTTFNYDASSRVVLRVDPATTDAVTGRAHLPLISTQYDQDGNPTQQIVADYTGADPSRTTSATYDASNRLATSTDGAGNVTTYGYDTYGNRTKVVDPEGAEFAYTYSPTGHPTQSTLKNWKGRLGDETAKTLVLESKAYDPAGRLATTTDAMGRTRHVFYYDDNLVGMVRQDGFRNADGTTRDIVLQRNEYDNAGNMIRQTVGGTDVTESTFNAANLVTKTVRDPGGLARTDSYSYARDGEILATTHAQGTVAQTTKYVYNPAGMQISKTVGDSTTTAVTSWTRDQRGLALTQTEPRGNVNGADKAAFTTTFGYDEVGRQIKTISPTISIESAGGAPVSSRAITMTGYNTFGEVAESSDANGNITTRTWSANGINTVTAAPAYTPPGATTPLKPTVYSLPDKNGRPVADIDAKGAITQTKYDALGNAVQRKDPALPGKDAGIWSFYYNDAGERIQSVAPDGGLGTATYDDLGRQVTATTLELVPTGKTYTTKYTYSDTGERLSTVGPNGETEWTFYNALHEPTVFVDATQRSRFVERDLNGKITKSTLTDGTYHTQKYDALGRPTITSDYDADNTLLRLSSTWYDVSGNVVQTIDPKIKATRYEYDAVGRRTRQVEPGPTSAGIVTAFGYDAAGNRTRYTDGNGNVTTTTYNSLGLQASMVEPATTAHPAAADRTWSTTYDLGGRPVKETRPGGVNVDRTYNVLGGLTSQTATSTGPDAASSSKTFDYDRQGRLVKASTPSGDDTFGYDWRSHIVSTSGPSGTSSFAYDHLGRMTSRTDASGTSSYTYDEAGRTKTATDAVTGTNLAYSYDGIGQLTQVAYGGMGGSVRTFGYDKLHRMTSDVLKTSTGAQLNSITTSFDAADRMTGKTTDNGTGPVVNTYGYDDAGRLTSWNNGSTTVPYEYDNAGNRTRDGPRTATYDQRNRLLGDGAYTYEYTARGTLAKKTTVGGSAFTSLTYDAFDRLTADGSSTYTYDSLDRVLTTGGRTFAYSGTGNDLATDGADTYSRGANGDLIGIRNGSTGQADLAVVDEHSDMVATFQASGTTLSRSVTYSPYGQVLSSSGPRTSVGYQSGWTDAGSGKVNMAARWYDPSTGAFASRDGVTLDPSASTNANRYAYASGNPLMYTDPTGHWSIKGALKKVGKVAAVAAPIVGGLVGGAAGMAIGNPALGGAIGGALGGALAYGITTAINGDNFSFKELAYQSGRGAIEGAIGGHFAKVGGYAAQFGFGAFASGIGYGFDVVTGRADFNWGDLAMQMAIGGFFNAAGRYVSNKWNKWRGGREEVEGPGGRRGEEDGPGGRRGDEEEPAARKAREDADAKAREAAEAEAARKAEAARLAEEVRARSPQGAADDASAGKGRAYEAATTYAPRPEPIRPEYLAKPASIQEAQAQNTVRVVENAPKLNDGTSTATFTPAEATNTSSSRGGSDGSSGPRARETSEQGSCQRPNSFVPGTQVLMADGSHKSIENVRIGDEVLADDPETGRGGARMVTAEIGGSGSKNLVELTVDVDGISGDRTETLTATDGHPFWVPELHKWQKAMDLRPGQWLRTSAGTWVQVTVIRSWTQQATVHNLTVDDLHTYYVLAGATPILVHNANLPVICGPITSKTHFADVEVFDAHGNQVDSYSLRSGATTPEEASLGTGRARQAVHTENRAARASGGASMIGDHEIPNDPFWGASPAPDGGLVRITGTRPPCGPCQKQMKLSDEDVGVTFEYRWPDGNGGMNTWTTDENW
ncbi:LamG-like jellyroll fold domain-containing protein [Embleya sp. NPDC059237]|uniref:LamG-like jellyroll fold domain-containing protein n=1 Tax=Embleya sp. NPDC059237 TaxID=3346784 RepID=UPI0036B8D71A